MSDQNNHNPDTILRTDELRLIITQIHRKQNCSLVGPSNSGKSTLVRSLQEIKSRADCDDQDALPIIFVMVDCQFMTDDETSFYELILRNVVASLQRSSLPNTAQAYLQEKYDQFLSSSNEVAYAPLFTSALNTLLDENDLRLVLILDEFDDALVSLPPWPFRSLRALHDEHNGKFLMVVATSRRLDRIRPDAMVYDFRELFHTSTLFLAPMTQDQSEACFNVFSSRLGREWNDAERQHILHLAGGHPGMIRVLLETLAMNEFHFDDPSGSLVDHLLALTAVQHENQRLWEELEVEEQELLLIFADKGANGLTPVERQALENRRLLTFNEKNQLSIFSPMFDSYIRRSLNRTRKAEPVGVYCDIETNRIFVNGVDQTLKLTKYQRDLLRFLYERAGEVCKDEAIYVAVYGADQGVNKQSLSELVKRTRQKVESDPDEPVYLVRVRGEGYMLCIPELD